MKRALLTAAVLTAACAGAWASPFSSSNRGTTAADFLNFAVGARAAGLGGAYSSVADDATALYWNPAALTRIEHHSAAVMHASFLDSSFYEYAAYGQSLGKWGAAGASLQYFSPGSIPQTDASGNDLGTFHPYDMALSAGYAFTLPEYEFLGDLTGFSFGISGKFIESKILSSAHAGAVDLGILTPSYLDGRLRFAFTATNLGGQLAYEQVYAPLPETMRVGGAFKLTPSWLIASDAVWPVNDNAHGTIGTEYWLTSGDKWKFAGRAGFDSQTIGSVTGFTGASMGFGVRYAGAAIDYAFSPYGGVGQAQRVSLSYDF